MIDLQNYPRLLAILADHFHTSGGVALRDLLWSIQNEHGQCNLWECLTALGQSERAELVQMMLLDMDARSKIVQAILETSGEWDRVDTIPTRAQTRHMGRGEA